MNNTTTKPEPYNDSTVITFGMHKGKKLANVPAQYLLYLYDKGCDHVQLMQYIQDNLDALNKEAGKGRR
jgi:uncharacterized protein (DUF3820 family)